MRSTTYTTRRVAEMAGIHRDTLLRWLREGRIAEPCRDRNNWRIFTPQEAEAVVRYAKGTLDNPPKVTLDSRPTYHLSLPYADSIPKLCQLDWDFSDANTGYPVSYTHLTLPTILRV